MKTDVHFKMSIINPRQSYLLISEVVDFKRKRDVDFILGILEKHLLSLHKFPVFSLLKVGLVFAKSFKTSCILSKMPVNCLYSMFYEGFYRVHCM